MLSAFPGVNIWVCVLVHFSGVRFLLLCDFSSRVFFSLCAFLGVIFSECAFLGAQSLKVHVVVRGGLLVLRRIVSVFLGVF